MSLNTSAPYDKSDCIIWLKNPLYDPISQKNISNNLINFTQLSCVTLKLLTPDEIYEINENMFKILGLNEYYDVLE